MIGLVLDVDRCPKCGAEVVCGGDDAHAYFVSDLSANCRTCGWEGAIGDLVNVLDDDELLERKLEEWAQDDG